jgi:hypothetical protein
MVPDGLLPKPSNQFDGNAVTDRLLLPAASSSTQVQRASWRYMHARAPGLNQSGEEIRMTRQPFRTGVFIIGLMLAAGACQREGADEQSPGVPPGAPPPAAEQPQGEPIRDVNIIIVASDRAPLLGRQVELTGATVQRVSNDRVFWVGATQDRAFPVYLDDQARSALLSAQQRLAQGDRVTIVGEVRKPPGVDDLQRQWNMAAQDAEDLSRSQAYIHAIRIMLGQQQQPGMQPVQPPGQPGQQPGQQPVQPGQPQPGQPGQPGQTPQPG